MSYLIDRLLQVGNDIERFRFCGPSDDLEQQDGVIAGFRILATKFVGIARRVHLPEIDEQLDLIDLDVSELEDVARLRAGLEPILDIAKDVAAHPELRWIDETYGSFIAQSAIDDLKRIDSTTHDLTKLVRFCEEINSSYRAGSYIAVSLLIRALINHVPPIFGAQTFREAVSQCPRSVKELLGPLEDALRDVADLHTHMTVRHKETLPTRNQVEPFKANVEVLLHEIVRRMSNA